MLSTEDVKDIEQSFQVLDDAKIGTIDMDRFYTLWLGLGFDPRISKDELAVRHVPQDRQGAITLHDVLEITSCYSRDRSFEMTCSFRLLDRDGKESITASDLVALAKDNGESLLKEEAQAMLGDKDFWTLDDLHAVLS